MPFFERYLSVWVGLAIIAGVGLGLAVPPLFQAVAAFEYAHVNLAVALFIWVMVYPMMIQIDFTAIKKVGQNPRGLLLTLVINWLIKPFTMAALGWLFFKVLFAGWVDPQTATEYIAGMILLGVAPCTAMVFVWSHLTKGDANYTSWCLPLPLSPPCCWVSVISPSPGIRCCCPWCCMWCCR